MKRTPLRSKAAERDAARRLEPGRREWKTPVVGNCAVCGTRGLLVNHHVILEQHVRSEGGDPWDLRNALPIGAGYSCACHRNHHAACRRLPRSAIPPAAIEFAVELFGREQAEQYLARYYA